MLITDLCQAARIHGKCALASNGSGGRGGNDHQLLLCSNGRKYCPPSSKQVVPAVTMEGTQSETMLGTEDATYRATTYIGDKKNSRGSSGKALKRRSSTQRDTKVLVLQRL